MNLTLNHVVTHVFTISPELLSRVDKLMATLADFTAKLDGIDAKVAEIAAEIAELKAKVDVGGMTADEEKVVLDRLDTLTGALEAAK